jgi:ribosomal protein S18 acetylase RimI-like enzyme
MTAFILDNGLESPLNRGEFYACRDARGQLEGVALIGHLTMLEARSNEAIRIFAQLAQRRSSTSLIIGEREKLRRFWDEYGSSGQQSRLLCQELLFEQRLPTGVLEEVPGLRLATLDDIDLIVPIHAQIANEESGIDPLVIDAAAFRSRCARRIEKGRVWVLIQDGRLIFKVDVVSETPEVIYLEGTFVDPQERGKGYGLRCLSEVSRHLLKQVKSICLLVNEENHGAQSLYRRAGYHLRSHYETIFLKQTPV